MTMNAEEVLKVMEELRWKARGEMLAGDHGKLNEARYAVEQMAKELSEVGALLPGVYYMDPPDGGDVSVIEQLRRMAKDAGRCERAKALAQKWRTHEVGETCEANVGYNRARKHCANELEEALGREDAA